MKVTKFVHSCLLVETPDRAVIFDPGVMSESALDPSQLQRLDDIFITHSHADHVSVGLLRRLLQAFPAVRITAPRSVVDLLAAEAIKATPKPPAGVAFFDSPHEDGGPLFETPEQQGYHYLEALSHPGDSHHFRETKAILALPVTAPWGSHVNAVKLALELQPRHVLPIHDWHWNDAARDSAYDAMARIFGGQGITFYQLPTGQPVTIEL